VVLVGILSGKNARALTKAEAEVARLEQAEARWLSDAAVKRQALADLEATAGEQVLADETGTVGRQLAVDATELRYGIDGAEKAAQAARRQLADARGDLALAQAAIKREEAAKLTAVADAHDAKVGELLRQLRELEGVDYAWHQPSVDEQHAMRARGERVEWTIPNGDVLRNPVAALLAEAEALEAPVLEERRAREAAARPLAPSATISVPRWDDVDSDSQVSCRVSEGAGSATFEVSVGGQQGGTWTVTLPDEQGRRAWGKRVRIQAGGGGATIRCNGQVLAKDTRPGRLMNDGLARWWVDATRCPGCRQLAPVTKRAPSPTSSRTDGAILAIDCQSGCDIRPRDLAGQGQR
jgi:hypothetical protein